MIKKALSQHNLGLVHLLDIEPVELARQITLLENGLFCQIEPFEIIGQGFKKKKSQAVHVKAMIQKSTQITSWISDSVLNEVDVKKRANLLKYWIKVGDVSTSFFYLFSSDVSLRPVCISTTTTR
jgi:hypothetical protein